MRHLSSPPYQLVLTSVCILLTALRSAEFSSAAAVAAASNATTAAAAAAAAVTTAAATTNATVAASSTTAHAATAAAATTAAATTSAATTAAATTAAATTAAATTAAATTTQAATAPKRLCAFPFWHRDQWHHECLAYGGKGARWCSLTQNFTHDEEWRECAAYDLLLLKCSIPFHYNGLLHTECQRLELEPLARPTFWCPLVPSLSNVTWQGLGTSWIFCEAPEATYPGYATAVGGNRTLSDARAAVAAAAAAAPSGKSPGADSSSSTGPAGGSAIGIALGLVGVILAAVAVAAAFAVHRRKQYKRIDPLLSSEPSSVEKSSYGGMQAYHD